jgi:hypothetical protein
MAILVASVALFIFGALWYTVLFGKFWAKLMEFTPEQLAKGKEEGMAKPLIVNFLLNLLTACVIYYLYPQILAVSFSEFIKVILVIWLGFGFPVYVNQALWEKKSWKLVVLNSIHGIIYFTIAGSVIYYLQ